MTGGAGSLRPDRLGLWLLRRLLAFWVREQIVPADPRALGIDDGAAAAPVFYITESRSLANLLVLEHVCARLGLPAPTAPLELPGPARADGGPAAGPVRLRSAVAAAINSVGWWRRRPDRRYSQTLRDLLAAAARQPGLAVQLVPVAVFFGRRPDRESSSLKLLLSDNSLYVGRLRKAMIVLLHGRNTWVQFGVPVSLAEFVAQAGARDPQRATRKLSLLFRRYFRQQRSAAVGPELTQLEQLVAELLRGRPVREAIAPEAADGRASAGRLRARARRYGYEIAANMSYPFLLLMRRLLRRLWDRLYDGVEVNHIDTVQRIAPGHTLVYLPCHRSHIDYLLLSYVLHGHGLAVPHVAAGVNLNLPLVGGLLRRGGAFFLRRSFRGQRLYAAVFIAYLSRTLRRGFSVEYFIEGGRSRTGLLLQPKPGMLDMTVRSYLAERGRPLVFVPVYIGYEKLVEARSYQAELSGAKKQQESLFGLLRGLKALYGEFGKVHLNFGEPIPLQPLLDRHRPAWRGETVALLQRPDWLPPLIDELGRAAMTAINRAAAVTPINLLALTLLATPRRALAESDLRAQLALTLEVLAATASPPLTVTTRSPAGIIEHGLRLAAIRREAHPLGAIVAITPNADAQLAYLRNNVRHVFVLPGLVACCLLYAPAPSRAVIAALCRAVYPLFHDRLFLDWRQTPGTPGGADLDDGIRRCLTLFADAGLLDCHGDPAESDDDTGLAPARHDRRPLRNERAERGPAERGPAERGPASRRLRGFAAVVLPELELCYLLLTVLQTQPAPTGADELSETCRLLAQRLARLYLRRDQGFADRAAFEALLQALLAGRRLDLDAEGRVCAGDDLGAFYRHLGRLLPDGVSYDIVQLAGGMPH